MDAASCGGKVQYETYTRASRAAKDLRRRKSAHAQAYACQDCGAFHVGNTIGPEHLSRRLRRRRLDKIRERETRV